MSLIKIEDFEKLNRDELVKTLENFHTFVSSYSFWIDKVRIPNEVLTWPVLEKEILGDYGYHGIIDYSLGNGPKLVPIKQKIRGISLWQDCQIIWYPQKRSVDIFTRTIFEDIYSQNERNRLKTYLNEMSKYINKLMGFTDSEFNKLKENTLNFGTRIYMVNPRREFHSGGGLSLKDKTIDQVLDELFTQVDIKTKPALKSRSKLLN